MFYKYRKNNNYFCTKHRKKMINLDSTIVAQSTQSGGALNVVRLSGPDSITICNNIFSRTIDRPRHAYFGQIRDTNNSVIDEVVLTSYVAPASFTGENLVEISCHGSSAVTAEIIRLCIKNGATPASAGEFTQRAFLNQKLNLVEAEAIGDLIVAGSKSAATVAINQMRGDYTTELSELRAKLLKISALIELELDFGEEDVEFASREELTTLLLQLKSRCESLSSSFSLGNVLKNGVPVAIIGKPNVGKSTLLNRLVGEERAIVSDIAGTTRDYLEEVINIEGTEFRFIDTAGIRHTNDAVEAIGVERSLERMAKAHIIIQLADTENGFADIEHTDEQKVIKVLNKCDDKPTHTGGIIRISAKYDQGIDLLRDELLAQSGAKDYNGEGIVISNARHYSALERAIVAIDQSLEGVSTGISGDFISSDIFAALEAIGEITGEITTDAILGEIFANFCIGK